MGVMMSGIIDNELLDKLHELVSNHMLEILDSQLLGNGRREQSIDTSLRITRTINYYLFQMSAYEKSIDVDDITPWKFVSFEDD
jgi:hypothetical protein